MVVVVKGVLLVLVEAPGATSVAFHNEMVLPVMLVLCCNIKAVLEDSKGAWSSRGDACLGPEEVTCLLQCEFVSMCYVVGEAHPFTSATAAAASAVDIGCAGVLSQALERRPAPACR